MHPVLELLLERGRAGSRPGDRRDGARLGLAIEGGGMRGVVTAGMVTALERRGLLSAFDVVFGSSAGAVNGAFFVAGQAAFGTAIYYEEINNRRFLSLARALTRRPVMSLPYLLDDVMTRRKALDWRAVIESPAPLKVVASAIDNLETQVFADFEGREHLFAALRASSNIPLVAGPPVEIEGRRYLDALLSEPVPFRSALDDGCTHVLVLLSRPEGHFNVRPSLVERHLLARGMSPIATGLAEHYLIKIRDYDDEIRHLRRETADRGGPPFLCAVSLPPSSRRVEPLEKARARLTAAADAGFRAIEEALHGARHRADPMRDLRRRRLAPGRLAPLKSASAGGRR